jgi:ribosomal protein S7
MNKKSKIIRSNEIINQLNSYNKLPPISLFIPIFQKFINNIMKNGKKNSAEKQLAFLIYY